MTNVSFTTRKIREKQGQRSKNDNRNRESCKVMEMNKLSVVKNGGAYNVKTEPGTGDLHVKTGEKLLPCRNTFAISAAGEIL